MDHRPPKNVVSAPSTTWADALPVSAGTWWMEHRPPKNVVSGPSTTFVAARAGYSSIMVTMGSGGLLYPESIAMRRSERTVRGSFAITLGNQCCTLMP